VPFINEIFHTRTLPFEYFAWPFVAGVCLILVQAGHRFAGASMLPSQVWSTCRGTRQLDDMPVLVSCRKRSRRCVVPSHGPSRGCLGGDRSCCVCHRKKSNVAAAEYRYHSGSHLVHQKFWSPQERVTMGPSELRGLIFHRIHQVALRRDTASD
jgi:hypothetical protein